MIAVEGANSKTLLDDAYTLTADSRFTELWRVELLQFGVRTTQVLGDTGTFQRTGSSIRFSGLGGSLLGELKNDTLRVSDQTGVLIYTK